MAFSASYYRLRRVLGGYEPAFFRIELEFPFYNAMHSILNLAPKDLSVFVHEYIHFIQDISTFSGLNNAYVYSEYIHGAVTHIYKMPKGDIEVPIALPSNYGNIELNQFVNEIGLGWTDEEVTNLFISKLKKNRVRVPFNSYLSTVDEVFIIQVNGKKLPFGAHAIRESMAYILEHCITDGSPSAPDYPYNAAFAVAKHVYEDFCENELNVLALCDMCLQFSVPGRVFVETLEGYKKDKYIPKDPRDIYDFFYNRPCIQIQSYSTLLSGLLPFGIFVGERINDYYKDPLFSRFHDIVRRLIGTGLSMRLNARSFLIDMAEIGLRNKRKLEKNDLFMMLYAQLGTPVIKDSESNYFITPPYQMAGNTAVSYFQAIQQFIYLFRDGNTCCSLYEWCEKSSDSHYDDRCIMEPWSRCDDERLCPFALLWKHWNLRGHTPVERYS